MTTNFITFSYFISISIHSRHIACHVRYAPHLPILPHMAWVDPRNWFTDTFPRVSCVWKSRRSEGESNPGLMRESSESYKLPQRHTATKGNKSNMKICQHVDIQLWITTMLIERVIPQWQDSLPQGPIEYLPPSPSIPLHEKFPTISASCQHF